MSTILEWFTLPRRDLFWLVIRIPFERRMWLSYLQRGCQRLATPVAVSATNVVSREKGYYDAPESFRIDYTYADGVLMAMFSTTENRRWGVKFIGTEGWIFTENTRLDTEPASLRNVQIKEDEVHLYTSANHQRDFIDCISSREPTAAPAETAHRAATICHLGAIAAVLRRPLRFSPSAEQFAGDEDANAMLTKSMRDPWKLV
jgi:hypothetical protein